MPDNWKRRGSRVERLSRAVLSSQPGVSSGRVAQASPTRSTNRQERGAPKDVEVPFSYPGPPVLNLESPPYFNTNALYDIGNIAVSTSSFPTSSTTVAVIVNGSTIGTVTLPAGNRSSTEAVLSYTLQYGDLVTVKCTAVGSDLDGLTVQIAMTDG